MPKVGSTAGALDLDVRDLSLDTPSPTFRVRSGKGGNSRLVPMHPELHGALIGHGLVIMRSA